MLKRLFKKNNNSNNNNAFIKFDHKHFNEYMTLINTVNHFLECDSVPMESKQEIMEHIGKEHFGYMFDVYFWIG